MSSGDSHEFSRELEKPERKKHVMVVVPASSDSSQLCPAKNEKSRRVSPANNPTVDEDENQSRPRSVIARLMGLEPLTSLDKKPPVTVKSLALPRYVHVVRSNYIDGVNFQVKQPNQLQKQSVEHIVRDDGSNVSSRGSVNGNAGKSMENESPGSENLKSEASRTSSRRLGSYFRSGDFFPEQNQTTVIMNGDFEKKLKMRGMDEQVNDLNALKQILEVLQLKGLLHPTSHRNFVGDRNLHSGESSIHLKQWRSLASKLDNHRSVKPVKVRASSSNRIDSNLKSCNSIIKTKPLSIEIQSPIDSPTLKPINHGSVHHSITDRSPRNHKRVKSSSIDSPNHNFIKNVVTDDESQVCKCKLHR